MANIKQLIADFTKQKDELIKQVRDNFGKSISALVKDDVEAIRWTQYAPYFNDGDECVFSVHEVRVKFKGIEDGGDYDDGYLTTYDTEYEAHKKVIQEINAAVAEVPDEIMKDVFGNHIQVTVTAEGLGIEEYEHD